MEPEVFQSLTMTTMVEDPVKVVPKVEDSAMEILEEIPEMKVSMTEEEVFHAMDVTTPGGTPSTETTPEITPEITPEEIPEEIHCHAKIQLHLLMDQDGIL